MRTYKLYSGNVNATASNITSTQILRNGIIKRIRWALSVDSVTDNAELAMELSVNPVSQVGLATIQGAFDEIRWAGNFATSGLAQGGVNATRDLDFPVGAGEFMYLNAYVAGTLVGHATIFVDVQEGK
jgi:hypothetical protein